MNNSVPCLVTIEQNIPLADSREIAQELGIEHRSFFKLILEYQEEMEEDFGKVRFEITPSGKTNQPQRYVLLTEDQTYAYLAYSQNTEQARACKRKLVKGFSEARVTIAQLKFDTPLPRQDDAIVEAIEDPRLLRKLIRHLQGVEQVLYHREPVQLAALKLRPVPTPKTIEEKILAYVEANQHATDPDKMPTVRNLCRRTHESVDAIKPVVASLIEAGRLQPYYAGKAICFALLAS